MAVLKKAVEINILDQFLLIKAEKRWKSLKKKSELGVKSEITNNSNNCDKKSLKMKFSLDDS